MDQIEINERVHYAFNLLDFLEYMMLGMYSDTFLINVFNLLKYDLKRSYLHKSSLVF